MQVYISYLSTGNKEVMDWVVQVFAEIEQLDKVGSNKSELCLWARQPYRFDNEVVTVETSIQG